MSVTADGLGVDRAAAVADHSRSVRQPFAGLATLRGLEECDHRVDGRSSCRTSAPSRRWPPVACARKEFGPALAEQGMRLVDVRTGQLAIYGEDRSDDARCPVAGCAQFIDIALLCLEEVAAFSKASGRLVVQSDRRPASNCRFCSSSSLDLPAHSSRSLEEALTKRLRELESDSVDTPPDRRLPQLSSRL